MHLAQTTQARYLLAELNALCDELRRSTPTLSRSQLAELAERARRDAEGLTGQPQRPLAKPREFSHDERLAGPGAQIIPLFGRRTAK